MHKVFLFGLTLIVSFIFFGCDENGTEVNISFLESSSSNASLSSSVKMQSSSSQGFYSSTFTSSSSTKASSSSIITSSSSEASSSSVCSVGFLADANTLYLEDFETTPTEGTLVKGICGNALSLKPGESGELNISLTDSLDAGTVQFWFRPGDEFFSDTTRVLLGTDQARLLFYYANGSLYFQKNITDHYVYVSAVVAFENGWNLVAAQWGNDHVDLYLNDILLNTKNTTAYGYQPYSSDPSVDPILVGEKTYCCISTPGVANAMSTSGDFDQLRISNIQRYVE
jgi:hypothetical protein